MTSQAPGGDTNSSAFTCAENTNAKTRDDREFMAMFSILKRIPTLFIDSRVTEIYITHTLHGCRRDDSEKMEGIRRPAL